MDSIGLTSRQVVKNFQFVAIVLIGAVLGGAQCIELCSLRVQQSDAKAKQGPEQEMPCHQKHAPKHSQPPASDEPCSHHELVAEKRSKASSADELQGISLLAVCLEPQVVPVYSSAPLPVLDQHRPAASPLSLSSILRI